MKMALNPTRRLMCGALISSALFAYAGNTFARDTPDSPAGTAFTSAPDSRKVIQEVEQVLSQGDFVRAEELCKNALALFEKEKRKSDVADIYGYLGFVYQMKDDLDQAETSYYKAIELNKALARQSDVARVYGNLGSIEQSRGNTEKATSLFLQSSQIARQSKDEGTEANALANLGGLYGSQGDLNRAEENFCKALELFKNMDNSKAESSVQDILDSMGSNCEETTES